MLELTPVYFLEQRSLNLCLKLRMPEHSCACASICLINKQIFYYYVKKKKYHYYKLHF